MTTSRERFGQDRLIDRPALRLALDEALNKRLTLVVAQAGAGKTTLLRQWSDSHGDREFAFLDVAAGDDDPVHFTRRIIAALAVVDPALDRVAKSISLDKGLSAPAMGSLATALESVPEVVIVIDNVERFSNVRLVADLGELVSRIPHHVHVVLSSRFDPPIALSKYRLDDELLELRQAELAFNDDESAKLLKRVSGRSLTPSQVRALRERTEGWAAGLQLAGLGLRQELDADAFIAEFGGSDRLVADYLGEEVLSILPAERRELLLQTSALDDLCAGLVEAVTGFAGAQSFLEELERESMFLVPLDAHRDWFRFHHLFCELLRSRLRAENPAGELRILTKAAHWHLERGRVKPAMEYLLRAQAWDEALGAMLPSAADVAESGDMMVAPWTPSVPEPVQSPRVNAEMLAEFRHAVGHHLAGQRTTSRPASDDLRGPSSQLPTGLSFVAAQVLWRVRPEVSIAAARRRLDEIEAFDPEQADRGAAVAESSELAGALVAGGRAYFLARDTGAARRWLLRGLIAAASDVVERLSAMSALSLVEAWCGNTEQAEVWVHDALQTAREAGLLAHPSLADAYLASVLSALDRDEPTTYRAADTEAREPALGALGQARTLAPTALFERAAELLASGDTEKARDIVSAWDQLTPEPEALSAVQQRVLLAWIAVNDEAPVEVTRQLTEAVKIAEIYGFVDVFVRCGPIILDRLSTVSGPHAAFSDIIRVRAQRSMTAKPGRDLPDPLTDRELEILAYLPTRFTNVELARRCFVSVNTIKTHMAHIYRKLDATNRDTAISRAREFGLL